MRFLLLLNTVLVGTSTHLYIPKHPEDEKLVEREDEIEGKYNVNGKRC